MQSGSSRVLLLDRRTAANGVPEPQVMGEGTHLCIASSDVYTTYDMAIHKCFLPCNARILHYDAVTSYNGILADACM